jgi:hypothetical protein
MPSSMIPIFMPCPVVEAGGAYSADALISFTLRSSSGR